jgi:hypothetical protein
MLWAQKNKADEISGTYTAHRESKKQIFRKSEAKQPIGDQNIEYQAQIQFTLNRISCRALDWIRLLQYSLSCTKCKNGLKNLLTSKHAGNRFINSSTVKLKKNSPCTLGCLVRQ